MEEKRDNIKIITKVLNVIIVLAIIGIICVAGYIIITDKHKSNMGESDEVNNAKYLSQVNEVLELLEEKYYGDLDMEKVMEGAIKGMLNEVDDIYTRYVSEEDYNELLLGNDMEYMGLGIRIKYDEETEGIIVTGTMVDSPAEKAGIIAGDVFLKINDIECTYETYYDCIALMKSEQPTNVHIVYLRNSEILEKDIMTAKINSQTISSDVLEGGIGYIKIYNFDKGTNEEYQSHYTKLRNQNISSLIIDLRDNPGGLVSEVYSILKSMLPKGIVLKMVYKDGREKVYTNNSDNKLDIPLVVLVNKNSASASEIFAGSVKDYGIGLIVGTTTFGKGIVQSVNKLKLSSGALYITDSKYYTAGSAEIHGKGITPNVEIEAEEAYRSSSYIPYDHDIVLHKAMQLLNATEK